jgi:maleylacetate reductase
MTVLPQVIIYDVDLTMGLPAQMTITSGMNAIAHAVEALYAQECSPLIEVLALQGISSLSKALPILSKDLKNQEARSDALYGAWTCGTCLGAVNMSLHHKMCHVVSHLPTRCLSFSDCESIYSSVVALDCLTQKSTL